MRPLLLICFFWISCLSSAQTDTLNQVDTKGRKTGYWKVWVNERADAVKSQSEACFYAFEYWEEGRCIITFYRHKWKFIKLTYDSVLPPKGQPVPLAGTFKWYDKHDRLVAAETFSAGYPKYCKSYSGPQSEKVFKLNEDLDFTKRYNNQPGTFYIEIHFSDDRKPLQYWYRKGKKGWRSYKMEEGS